MENNQQKPENPITNRKEAYNLRQIVLYVVKVIP